MGKAKWLNKVLPFLLILCSFNRIDYNSVLIGTSAAQVVQRFGEPYAVHEMENGVLEYEYIERVSMNSELIYENHYFLTVLEGKVVSKRFREVTRPGYDQIWQTDPNYPNYP